jgi:hypothetical protein
MALGDLTFVGSIPVGSGIEVRGIVNDSSPGYKLVFNFTNSLVLTSYKYNSGGGLTFKDSKTSSGGTTGLGLAIDIVNKVIITSEFTRIRTWSYDIDGILTPGGTAACSQQLSASVDTLNRTVFLGGGSSGLALATYLADGSGFSALGSYYNTTGGARHSAADVGRGFVFLNDFNNGIIAFSYSGIAVPVLINIIAGNIKLTGYQGMAIDTVNRLVFSGDDVNGLISNIYNGSTGVIAEVQNIPGAGGRNSRGVIIDQSSNLVFVGVEGTASYTYDSLGNMVPGDVIYNPGGQEVEAIAIDTEWYLLFEADRGTDGTRVLSYEGISPSFSSFSSASSESSFSSLSSLSSVSSESSSSSLDTEAPVVSVFKVADSSLLEENVLDNSQKSSVDLDIIATGATQMRFSVNVRDKYPLGNLFNAGRFNRGHIISGTNVFWGASSYGTGTNPGFLSSDVGKWVSFSYGGVNYSEEVEIYVSYRQFELKDFVSPVTSSYNISFNIGTWSDWEAYNTSKTIDMTASQYGGDDFHFLFKDETRRIWIELRDDAGNVTIAYSTPRLWMKPDPVKDVINIRTSQTYHHFWLAAKEAQSGDTIEVGDNELYPSINMASNNPTYNPLTINKALTIKNKVNTSPIIASGWGYQQEWATGIYTRGHTSTELILEGFEFISDYVFFGTGTSGGTPTIYSWPDSYGNVKLVKCIINWTQTTFGYFLIFDRCHFNLVQDAINAGYWWFTQDCSFIGCTANIRRGKKGFAYRHNKIVSCTFVRDSGIDILDDTAHTPWNGRTIENCIFYNGAIYSRDGITLIFQNCCFYNTPISGLSTLENCITANPQFIDYLNVDYHIPLESPCIGTGKDTSSYVTEDIDGHNRPSMGNWDIGAYELTMFSSLNVGNIIDVSTVGVSFISTVYPDVIESLFSVSGDDNFNSSFKWEKVIIIYEHVNGQNKRLVHRYVGGVWTVRGTFSVNANAGTWRKNKIILVDHVQDMLVVDRSEIGTDEDVTVVT